MKHVLFSIAFLSLSLSALRGQVVWNREYPIKMSSNMPHILLRQSADRILFYGMNALMEMDPYGTVISTGLGDDPLPAFNFNSGYIKEKKDPVTGERYFVGIKQGSKSGTVVEISEYRIGQGWVNESVFPEVFASINSLSPVVVELNDSTCTIFGHRYVRQVLLQPGKPAKLLWERPFFRGEFNAAFRAADGSYLAVTHRGNLLSMSAEGDSLWSVQTGFTIRDVREYEGDLLLCGTEMASQTAVLARYSTGGERKWISHVPSDQSYVRLLIEGGGRYKLVGASQGGHALLRHFEQDTASGWQKTYQKGLLTCIAPAPDGNYLLGGRHLAGADNLFLIRADAQGNAGTPQPAVAFAYRRLEQEQVRATVGPHLGLFEDLNTLHFSGNLHLPKDSMALPITDWRLQIGGLSADSALHTAISYGRSDGARDIRPGLAAGYEGDWNRVWLLKRADIASMRQDWAEDGKIDRPIPHDIQSWPAKGNPYFKQNLDFTAVATPPDLLPAPFQDLNHDGRYDPHDGDYPLMQGDQMVWWMTTDSTVHQVIMGIPMVVEVAVSAWVYECPNEAALQNSILTEYEIINRAAHSYSNCFAGLRMDMELGCGADDYAGCIQDADTWYIYNGSDMDTLAGNICQNIPGFGKRIPVYTASLLNQRLDVFGAFPPPYPYPPSWGGDMEYYETLRGIYRRNGTGGPHFDTIPIMFPGNPSALDTLSMCGQQLKPTHYSTLASTGPFSLAPNDTFTLRLAFTYHPDIPHPCPDIFGTVKNDLAQLRSLLQSGALEAPAQLQPLVLLAPGQTALLDATVPLAQGYQWSEGSTSATLLVGQPGVYSVTITHATGCSSVETVLVKSSSSTGAEPAEGGLRLRLYPNPNDGHFRVEMSGPAHGELEFTLFDALGRPLRREVADFGSGNLSRDFAYGSLVAGVYALRVQVGAESALRHFVVTR
ncbi:MAG TPA: T9SS type A sorting domain-containing protein [Saprospiraceae bacterium]|nr:T9SS type A sorting domain-containing protein [Saprospiraceae bacterium]